MKGIFVPLSNLSLSMQLPDLADISGDQWYSASLPLLLGVHLISTP